ncbi:MAG: hypothetical protein IJW92_08475 [Clostridia bacterium]|nr:hypothetical protein [Clostridia bacterium]
MKKENRVEQYFYQKDFSILEIILLIIAIVSLIVTTFIQGGGPIGLSTLLVCVLAFFICRSFKIKDNEIEQALKKIMQDNKVKCSENAIECYELKNTVIKKRKDGKFISPKYYITDIIFSSEYTLFNIYIIDLIKQSVEMVSYSVNINQIITLREETIKTNAGLAKVSYLEIENGCVIPVVLNDYKSSQLLQKICDRHKQE